VTTTHWRIIGGFRCALSPAGNSDGGELDEVRRKGRGARFIARGCAEVGRVVPSVADFAGRARREDHGRWVVKFYVGLARTSVPS
jgi:hypothetical protein